MRLVFPELGAGGTSPVPAPGAEPAGPSPDLSCEPRGHSAVHLAFKHRFFFRFSPIFFAFPSLGSFLFLARCDYFMCLEDLVKALHFWLQIQTLLSVSSRLCDVGGLCPCKSSAEQKDTGWFGDSVTPARK